MERRLPIYKLTSEAPSEGSRMMAELLSHEIAPPPTGLRDLWEIKMHPEEGYVQLVRFVSKH